MNKSNKIQTIKAALIEIITDNQIYFKDKPAEDVADEINNILGSLS